MNPSTEDFVEAIEKLNAEHIFVLPNNSNIIMAAQQAAAVCEGENVHVIPSKASRRDCAHASCSIPMWTMRAISQR